MCVCVLSCFCHVRLFATPWTVACQAPLSMGFSRQEYWRGSPCPPLGDRPNPGIEPRSPELETDALTSEPPGKSMDCSLPGSSVHGILQARILEWVAIPFSRGSSQPREGSPTLQVDSLSSESPGKPEKGLSRR